MTKDKQKANKPLNPFVPLVLMVLACAIVSYFVINNVVSVFYFCGGKKDAWEDTDGIFCYIFF